MLKAATPLSPLSRVVGKPSIPKKPIFTGPLCLSSYVYLISGPLVNKPCLIFEVSNVSVFVSLMSYKELFGALPSSSPFLFNALVVIT